MTKPTQHPLPTKQLYERVVTSGGRVKYVPHSQEFVLRGFLDGHYHVHINGGCTSIYYRVDPDRPALFAAMKEAKDAMVRAMDDRRRPEGTCRQMDAATEAKGWAAFRKATGHDELLTFDGCSMMDVVEAGMAAVSDTIASVKG